MSTQANRYPRGGCESWTESGSSWGLPSWPSQGSKAEVGIYFAYRATLGFRS